MPEPEEEERNPIEDILLVLPKDAIYNSFVIQALCQTMLANQIEILSLLKKKPYKEVQTEILKKLEKGYIEIIDKLPKTV